MKRSVFIIIGVILVVVLIAVWVYVLFIASPASPDEQFADFGMGDTTDTEYEEPVPEREEEPVVDVSSDKRLRQLTTKPVAGFLEVAASTSTPARVQYMEVGTGHIYAINLETGEEKRVSGTTIPSTQQAVFSHDGQYVLVESGLGSEKEFVLGELNREESTLSNTQLAEPIISFSSTADNRFLYATQANASVIGKVYDPTELTSQTLFTLPFREATIEWGQTVSSAHYVYPKTTRQLESFLYQVKNGVVTRMPIDGFGMSAVGNDDYVLFSRQEDEAYQSYYLNTNTGKESNSPLVQLPEKCVMNENEFPITICASTPYQYSSLLPDSWYKGEIESADNLWEVAPEDGSATLLVNTKQESGRLLDITNISIGKWGSNIYFVNQTDRALWMYKRITTEAN